MQTLNVGAGQSEQDYKHAAEERRRELRAESQSDANYFSLAAGLAALGTGLLLVRLNILVNIGAIDLLAYYGRSAPNFTLMMYGAAGVWLAVTLALGVAARGGQRWAFLAGLVLYAADMLPLIMTFSLWAFGVHAFFLFRWFQGQKALKDLDDASDSSIPPVEQLK